MTDDLTLTDPTRHNWWRKLNNLTAVQPLSPGVQRILIRHADDCAIWQGNYCNCDPDVEDMDTRDQSR